MQSIYLANIIWITQTNYEMGHLLDYAKLHWCYSYHSLVSQLSN